MNEHRRQILQMLEARKITADEAERLRLPDYRPARDGLLRGRTTQSCPQCPTPFIPAPATTRREVFLDG